MEEGRRLGEENVSGFQTQEMSDAETLARSRYALRAAIEIERQKVMPVFKMVDTCAGEFESRTPYYYGTFEQEDDAA